MKLVNRPSTRFEMMEKKQLLSDDSDSDPESGNFQLKINEQYAERYTNWRQKEELQKLKDKYGDGVLSEGSGPSDSDDDSEDSDQEHQSALLTGDIFDRQFLEVYTALKKNDPKIYDSNFRYAEEQTKAQPSDRPAGSESKKKMNLMQYHMKLMEERQGVTEEDLRNDEPQQGYFEELSDIKNQLKAVCDDDDEEEDQLLQTVQKPENSDNEGPDVARQVLSCLDDCGDEADKFLKKFIIEKPFLSEVTYQKERQMLKNGIKENDDDEETEPEESCEDQKISEQLASHRFEEKGGKEIKRYPRNLPSVRDVVAKEEKSLKRQEVRERKKREKAEDLKRFSELRKQELASKLAKLQKTSENSKFIEESTSGFLFQSLVDDEVFDPEQHDQRMEKLFDEQYYNTESDDKKPEFEFVEGIDDMDPGEGRSRVIEAPESEEESEAEDEAVDGTLSRKRKKPRKRKVKKRKPLDIDNIPDYDDVVGGMPIRFKYCKVQPNDFGLSTEEILFSDDKELNAWVSLKKAVAYRDEDEEQKDTERYNKKRNNWRHKTKVLKTYYKEGDLEEPVVKKSKKRRRKKKSGLPEDVAPNGDSGEESPAEAEAEPQPAPETAPVRLKKSKQPVNKGHKRQRRPKKGVNEDRLRAYGFSKTEMKRKGLL